MPRKVLGVNRLDRALPILLLLWACEEEPRPAVWQSSGGRGAAKPDVSASGASGDSSGSGGEATVVAEGGAGALSGGSAGDNAGAGGEAPAGYPDPTAVLSLLTRANAHFMSKWPDPGAPIDSRNESHTWIRAVYFEGLMALYALSPEPAYYDYAVSWGESHAWGLHGGPTSVFADDQCAGQTYIDLYALDPKPERISAIRTSLDAMLVSNVVSNWWWIDAIQMSMPALAKFGVLTNDTRYFEKMAALYEYTRNSAGDASDPGGASGPLYDQKNHLWWRDRNFDPPFTTANGKPCFWSRGNGWVFAGLARVLAVLPIKNPHRELYLRDFRDMARALVAVQRSDGFWNPNLGDPDDFGGPELSGSSFFVYGLAWGVRSGLLEKAEFKPAVVRGWRAMASAVREDGSLGYVQGPADEPSDWQPISYDTAPSIDDFAVGAFLLGGSEVMRLGFP